MANRVLTADGRAFNVVDYKVVGVGTDVVLSVYGKDTSDIVVIALQAEDIAKLVERLSNTLLLLRRTLPGGQYGE